MRQTLPKRHATADRVRKRCDVSDIEQSGFSEFDRWLGLARRTRELLDAAVDEGGLPAGGADYLADRTLPHLEGVQVGFLGWLRADAAGVAELRYLIGRVAATRVEGPVDDAERRAAAAEDTIERSLTSRGARPARALRSAEPWNLGRTRSCAGRPRLPAEDPGRGGSLSVRPENLRRHHRPARARRACRSVGRARAPAVADRDRQDSRSRESRVPAGVRLLRRGRSARSEGIRPDGLTGAGIIGRSPRSTQGAHPTGRAAGDRTPHPGSASARAR